MDGKIKATVVELSDFVLFKAAGLNPKQALELVEQRRKHVQELLEQQPATRSN
jgi:hypothetical protein